jgi:DnaD/phage-associated family protein
MTTKQNSTKNIFTLYTENVGNITPMIRDQLIEDETEFGTETVEYAIREAVFHNARNMKYIEAILRRSSKPIKDNRMSDDAIRRYGEWDTTNA